MRTIFSVANNKGFLLVFALIIIALVILAITTLFVIAYNDLAMSRTYSNNMKAYYIAEAGLAKKFMDLRNGSVTGASGSFTISGSDSGTYNASVTQLVAGSFSTYRIDSTGTYKNATSRLSFTVRQVSFSRFAYLSNSENQMIWHSSRPIWFTTGDRLTGPLFTNDRLNISGNPIFEGPVSSADSSINYYHGGPPLDNPDFHDSITLGANPITMPSTTTTINAIKTASQSTGGLYLTGNTQITFLSNGNLSVVNRNKGWRNPTTVSPPTNGAIFVSGGYVNVAGVVNGSLAVGTDNDIYVTNSIVYNTDPRTTPSSTDMLGLVSQNNVIIDIGAPSDMEIDAYIIALNSSFTADGYDSVMKGTLTLYGGVTQDTRGAVGTFNATTDDKLSGYTKNYTYDQRLALNAPRLFPVARDTNGRVIYQKVSWSEL